MDLLRRMEGSLEDLTESESRVARVVLDRPEAAEGFSITRLAQEAGTSTSAVQRLCQSLGFAGYKDFRYELAAEGRAARQAPPAGGDAVAEAAGRMGEAVSGLALLDRGRLGELAGDLATSPLVLCTGIHHSSHPARKLRMDLEDLGVVALSAHDAAAASHLARLVADDSCVVHFSVAGSRMPLAAGGDGAAELPARSWLVTSNGSHAASVPDDHVFVLPSAIGRQGAALGDHVVMLAFVDIVIALVRDLL